MLAGSNERGTYNASNPADQAVSYVCLGMFLLSALVYSPNLRTHG
jgi:hypothetical protein